MCGVAGVLSYRKSNGIEAAAEAKAMCNHMAARGPDGEGVWASPDDRVALGHRRLSIIDLSNRGAQPMSSEDGALTITFNGEIYNYRALRAELEEGGCVFSSQSDTEVLLHLYNRDGPAMVSLLRGMFAFALWDARCCELMLARDPYGIKPLYYADDGKALRFASQVKALLAGGQVSRAPDPAGVAGFYLFGSVPEPYTTVRSISAIPAGSIIVVNAWGVKVEKKYFSLNEIYCAAEDVEPGKIVHYSEVREALLDSVRHHLVSDVPVGAFLSAGVDSGALLGLMRDAGQEDIQTVTLGFEEFAGGSGDETILAAETAGQYGARHTTRIVTESEFQKDLAAILSAMDQPSIDGVNTWFVSKAARELGLKVAISGVGGDELFGGYPSFRDLPIWHRSLAVPTRIPGVGPSLRRLITLANPTRVGLSPKLAGIAEHGGTIAGLYLLRRGIFMPDELGAVMDADFAAEGINRLGGAFGVDRALTPLPRTWFARVACLESSLYMRNQLLRDTDWASMAHSLEVRLPLVDSHLTTALAPYLVARGKLANKNKELLANAPRSPLPRAILRRRKTGFSVPTENWQSRIGKEDSAHPSPTTGSKRVREPWARAWAVHVSKREREINRPTRP